MITYQAEIDDGISDEILATASVRNLSAIPAIEVAGTELAFATNLGQPDLHYSKSLLVQTGLNRNWDYFPAKDTWEARNTPVDKLVDIGHDRDKIIGHQTAVTFVDAKGHEIVEEDYDKAGTWPDEFSIIDTDVIYLIRGTPDKTDEISTMIKEIMKGEWWVSMECKFNNFDYIIVPMVDDAMKADMSKAKIIERNEKNSFMSKYLRIYNKKADNTFEGNRIGRVLRDITFVGKGYVRVPANPTSAVYTFNGMQLSKKVYKSKASIEENKNLVYNNSDPIKEKTKMDELEKLKGELECANKNLLIATTAKTKADDDMDEAKKAMASLEIAKVDALKEVEVTKAKLYNVEKELAEANSKLGEIASAKRFESLVEKVKVAYKVEGEKAKAIAASLKVLDDKAIEDNLAAVANALAPVVPVVAPVVPAVIEPKVEEPKVDAPVVASLTVETPEVVIPVVKPEEVAKAKLEETRKAVSGQLASLMGKKEKVPATKNKK